MEAVAAASLGLTSYHRRARPPPKRGATYMDAVIGQARRKPPTTTCCARGMGRCSSTYQFDGGRAPQRSLPAGRTQGPLVLTVDRSCKRNLQNACFTANPRLQTSPKAAGDPGWSRARGAVVVDVKPAASWPPSVSGFDLNACRADYASLPSMPPRRCWTTARGCMRQVRLSSPRWRPPR